MKIHKFTDKKKELIAILLISLVVICVSIYVVYLVNRLTKKVYGVFGRPDANASVFTHFDFAAFEELGLRPKKATSTPVISDPVLPSVPSTTVASGTASSS